MANEIIKLLEYITNSGLFKGVVIGYIILALLVIALVIGVFVFALKNIRKEFRNNDKY